jgi:PAX-interacting protein 1
MGQSGLSTLQSNSVNAAGNALQSGMNLPQSSSQIGVINYQQSPSNSLQQSGVTIQNSSSVTSLPGQNGAIQQQILKQQQEQQQLLQAQQQHRLMQQQDLRQLQQQQQLLQQRQIQANHQKNQAAQLQAFQSQQQQQLLDPYSDLKMDASLKAKQAAVKQAMMQQQLNLKQRQMFQQQLQQQQSHKVGSPQLVSSPQLMQAPSPQMSQQMSPQTDQTFTPMQIQKTSTPPFRTPSPSTLPATPPTQDEADHKGPTPPSNFVPTPNTLQALQSHMGGVTRAINTPGMPVSPLMEGGFSPSPAQLGIAHDAVQAFSPGTPLLDKTNSTEPPLERLMRLVDAMSPACLRAAVDDMSDIVSCAEKLGASAPGTGSRAAIGEDLPAKTRSLLQARANSQESSNVPKKRRRVDSIALNMISADGTITNTLHRPYYNSGHSMVSHINSPRIKITPGLEEEIRNINSRLIDTIVEVSTEATEEVAARGQNGIVLSCCYKGNALSPNLYFLQAKEYSMVSKAVLYLTIPPTYPESSPDIWFDQSAPQANHYCFRGARDEFTRNVRCLQTPLSVISIATSWDECARNSLNEYATQQGGGNFTTAIGLWETGLTA